MHHIVKVPRVNANEDEMLVTSVAVSVGDWVEASDELFVIETSKSAVSVEAEVAGYVRSIRPDVDGIVTVGSTLCLISETPDELLPETEEQGAGTEGAGLIRESINRSGPTAKERLIERRSAPGILGTLRSVGEAQKAADTELVGSEDLPWVREARSLLDNLSNRQVGLATEIHESVPLSVDSQEYHSHGVYFGVGSRMGSGSSISAKRLYLAPAAQIGNNCHLEADHIYIGASAKIGDQTNIVTGELILGDGTVVADQVSVDLAGGRSEESRLLVGGGSLVSSRTVINTCREVVLERESALSPGAMIFTHSYWQSVLERYPVSFQGVRIGENAWVGAGCQILPGINIGAGSIIMSNSTVVENVPPFTMAGGVPATVIRSNIRRELDLSEQARVLSGLIVEFVRSIEFKGCTVAGTQDAGVYSITSPDGSNRHLALITSERPLQTDTPPDSILIALGQDAPVSNGLSVFDVTNKKFFGVEDRLTHELRNFLRRRGIRFKPYAWDSSFALGL